MNKVKEIKDELKSLAKITGELDQEEVKFIKAQEKFNELKPKEKTRALNLYQSYVSDDKTELQVAREHGVTLTTVKRALDIIGEQLVIFMKNKNIIVPMVSKIRRRKQMINEDMNKLVMGKNAALNIELGKVRVRYFSELKKLDELEARLLSLLENKVEIDQSKNLTIISHYKKPEPKTING